MWMDAKLACLNTLEQRFIKDYVTFVLNIQYLRTKTVLYNAKNSLRRCLFIP